jgi:hypothetical protein
MKNSRQALEEDVETTKMDAGGAHFTPDTDVRGARADATPRENDAQLDIYSRSLAQRITAKLDAGCMRSRARSRSEGPRNN